MSGWIPLGLATAAAAASIGGVLIGICAGRRDGRPAAEVPLVGKAESLATCCANEISIVSYNCLADAFALKLSDYATEEQLSWQNRWPAIKRSLLAWQADVVCLQEVDVTWLSDYLEFAERAGYNVTHQETKGKQVVCMTLFKAQKLQLWWQDTGRSRTLLSAFLFTDSTAATQVIYVANCHLEGAPHKPQERLRQLRNALSGLEKHQTAQGLPPADCHVVVCGDFNSGRREAAVKLLSSGFLAEGYREDHAPKQVVVPLGGGDITQPFLLRDVYDSNHLPFTRKVPALESVLDWIFASASLMVTGLLWPLDPSLPQDRRLPHSRTGLPNDLHPSDHLPIGVKLQCLPAGVLQH